MNHVLCQFFRIDHLEQNAPFVESIDDGRLGKSGCRGVDSASDDSKLIFKNIYKYLN